VRPVITGVVATVLVMQIIACQGFDRRKKPVPESTNPVLKDIERNARSLAYRGTVGEVSYVQGVQKMSVRGYGLVVGLGNNGSRTCPEHIRKRVAADIRRTYRLGDSRVGLGHVNAEKLINDPDTAVVRVHGEVGAAGLRGSRFDLFLESLAGTETSSLEGGHLYGCDLRIFRSVDSGTVQEGKIFARGEGRVFTIPPKTPSDLFNPRIGRIISGGTSLEDRRLFLRLASPSYAMAVRIQDRINGRFGAGDQIATADSPERVALVVPRGYFMSELEFLEKVRHLYMSDEVGFGDGRIDALLDELRDPQGPHDSIGLALEGIGKTVRPKIRHFYEDRTPHVSFHAARTGARLEDRLAVAPLEAIARDTESPYHMDAISVLGEARTVRAATRALHDLMSSDLRADVRIAAYEAYILADVPILDSKDLGGHFTLDIVASSAPGLIYAKTRDQSRIAVIGDVECRTPVFYKHPRDLLTLSGREGDRLITALRQTAGGRSAPPAYCGPSANEIIRLLGADARQARDGRVTGLGMSYSHIVEVVTALCSDGSLNARIILEKGGEDANIRPRTRTGRPESEL
jgi:hypothetical protein